MCRRSLVFSAALAVAAVSLVALAGCSIIGLSLGSISDSRAIRRRPATDASLSHLRSGTPVRLAMRDGGTSTGVSRGTTPVPLEHWVAQYAAVRETAITTGPLPALGDTVEAQMEHEWTLRGRLNGLTSDGVEILEHGKRDTRLAGFEDLDSLSWQGFRFSGNQIRQAWDRGRIPSHLSFRLETGADTLTIPIDRIAAFTATTRRHAKVAGFLIGLAADVMVFISLYNFKIFGP